MQSILDHMELWRIYQARKHDKGPSEEYAAEQINKLSNYEFLKELSDAIEARLSEDS